MSKGDSLGDRMKGYESVSKRTLIPRMPVILRLDGRAFHTFTKSLQSPFNDDLHDLMLSSTLRLMMQMQNAVFAYTQSDEISILLKDWSTHETEQWFGGTQNKIESVAASILTAEFNFLRATNQYLPEVSYNYATFDCRAFNLPREEVCNYFLWRQQDASRNSVQMLGREYLSHKQMHGLNNSQIQDRLMLDFGVNWNNIETWKRRGSCVLLTQTNQDEQGSKLVLDEEIPIFSQDRQYIEQFL